MKNLEKVFCYPDTLQNKFVPQAWQIFIMNSFLKDFSKKIQFYTGENHRGYKKMKIFSEKIKSKPKIHGYIFYSLLQFCYDEKINIDLISRAIKNDYTIYLAREKMVINSKNFEKRKQDIFFFKTTNNKLIKFIIQNFI
jgi:hypothetical protein